jgi:hypothetical protein
MTTALATPYSSQLSTDDSVTVTLLTALRYALSTKNFIDVAWIVFDTA